MLCLEENMWFCMNQRYQAKYYYVVCPSRLQLVPFKEKLTPKQRFIKARVELIVRQKTGGTIDDCVEWLYKQMLANHRKKYRQSNGWIPESKLS